MVDNLNTELVISALTKGFAEVEASMNRLVIAEKALLDQQKQSQAASDKTAAATKKAAEARRQAAEEARKLKEAQRAEIQSLEDLARVTNKSANILLAFGAAGAVGIGAATVLAARVETLGVVVDTVGGNLGYTVTELRGFEQAMVDQGITLQKARQGLALMAQAQLDLRKSTELATLAQNAAVIAGINSSEAFQRIVYTISAGNVRMARTMGLQVNFQQAYVQAAKEMGVAVTDLDSNTKANIRMQEVLRSGIAIQGAYDAAMTTAGKKFYSLARYAEEAARVIGEEYLGAFGRLIDMTTDALVWFTDLEETQRSLVITIGSSVVGWALLTGALSKVLAWIIKVKVEYLKMFNAFRVANVGQFISAQLGVVGPIGLVVAGIVAAVAAIHMYNRAIDVQVEKNEMAQQSLMDSSDTYEDYVKKLRDYAKEQELIVGTHDELAVKENELLERHKMIAGYSGDVATGFGSMAVTGRQIATAVEIMSEGFYDVGKAMGFTIEETERYGKIAGNLTMFQGMMNEQFEYTSRAADYYADSLGEVGDESEVLARKQKMLQLQMADTADEAMKKYAEGDRGAIRDFIMDLTRDIGELYGYEAETQNIAEELAADWGLLGSKTSEVSAQIHDSIVKAAKAGDWAGVANGIEMLTDELEKLAASAQTVKELEFIQSIDLGAVMEDFKGGEEDAFSNVIYDMVETGLQFEGLGNIAGDVLWNLQTDLGMFNTTSAEVWGRVRQWLNEYANTKDWDLLVSRLQGLQTELEEMGSTDRLGWMKDMKDAMGEMAASYDDWISSMSGKDIGSPIRQFREDLEWFNAGGAQLVQTWEAVKEAFGKHLIDEEELGRASDLLLIAESKIAVETGAMSKYEAIVQLTHDMSFEYEQATFNAERLKAIKEWEEDNGEKLVALKGEELDKANEQIDAMATIRAIMYEAGIYYDEIGDLPSLLDQLANIYINIDSLINAQEAADLLQAQLRKMSMEQYEVIINMRQRWLNEGMQQPPNLSPEGQPIYTDENSTSEEYQHGANFIVPPGYQNDTYRMRVSTGEHVLVTTPGQMQGQEINNSFMWSPTIRLDNRLDVDMFMDELMARFEERLR